MKPIVALYMGGMGAKDQNFHKQVFERMGYEAITGQVQELFLAGDRESATALIPDELVDDMHIIGTEAEVRDTVQAWEGTGVTTLMRRPTRVTRSGGSPRCSPSSARKSLGSDPNNGDAPRPVRV